MSPIAALQRETRLQWSRPAVRLILALTVLAAALSVGLGMAEVARQRAAIEQALIQDRQERDTTLAGYQDWGDIAYYGFHFTYDPPSELAFAALGQRDVLPWQHRIRMLALEGQIYESDTANPELAGLGQFDYALLTGLLLPLLVIVLLHDLQAGERSAGRHALLVATAGRGPSLWQVRAAALGLLLATALLVPFWIGALLSDVALSRVLLASAVVVAHLAFWVMVVSVWASRGLDGPVVAAWSVGLWLLLALLLPFAGRLGVMTMIPIPDGGEIVMTQREVVNGAWDRPKAETMDAFVATHPNWAAEAEVTQPFDWKWYYAFQQVGDQAAAPLSTAYRHGLQARDRATWRLAMASPPLWVSLALSRLANTDVQASLVYQQRVRDFHAQLRHYHYPLLFRGVAYDPAIIAGLPQYQPEG